MVETHLARGIWGTFLLLYLFQLLNTIPPTESVSSFLYRSPRQKWGLQGNFPVIAQFALEICLFPSQFHPAFFSSTCPSLPRSDNRLGDVTLKMSVILNNTPASLMLSN